MIALGILAYNEEKNILKIIQEHSSKFNEIIVVEDCSTDNTLNILNDAKKTFENLTVIFNQTNQGAGKSFEKLTTLSIPRFCAILTVIRFLDFSSPTLKVEGP